MGRGLNALAFVAGVTVSGCDMVEGALPVEANPGYRNPAEAKANTGSVTKPTINRVIFNETFEDMTSRAVGDVSSGVVAQVTVVLSVPRIPNLDQFTLELQPCSSDSQGVCGEETVWFPFGGEKSDTVIGPTINGFASTKEVILPVGMGPLNVKVTLLNENGEPVAEVNGPLPDSPPEIPPIGPRE